MSLPASQVARIESGLDPLCELAILVTTKWKPASVQELLSAVFAETNRLSLTGNGYSKLVAKASEVRPSRLRSIRRLIVSTSLAAADICWSVLRLLDFRTQSLFTKMLLSCVKGLFLVQP